MPYIKGRTPIEELKERVTCVQAAQALGLKINKAGDRCKSFRVGASNPTSLMVQDNHIIDFGSDQQVGDVIDLWCGVTGLSVGDAIKDIAQAFSVELPKGYKPAVLDSQQKLLQDATDLYHVSMTEKQRGYYHKRGLTDETIDKYKLGYGNNIKLKTKGYTPDQIKASGILECFNRYTIPYLHNDKAVYMISREDKKTTAKYLKLKKNDSNENAIYGLDSIKDHDDVYIGEGIFDALALLQEKYACISPITGRFSKAQEHTVIKVLKGKKAIICFDYDPKSKAGSKFTWALADKLLANGIETELIFIKGKNEKIDLNDLYNTPEKLKILETAEDAIECKISLIKSKKDAEKLIQLIANTMNAANAKTYIKQIGTCGIKNIDTDWAKDMYKICKEYSEQQLVEKVIEEQKILHLPKLNFYMYDEIKSLWDVEEEEFISQLILAKSPTNMTGSKIRSATHLAKVIASEKGIEFNENKEWLSVKNGMVNIHTMEFRKRTEEDFVTLTTDYDFDPNADKTEIEKFICDIADGKAERIRLLKQIMGYSLTKDVRYHKAFILYGKGRNGKSVFLDMVKHMVGNENVSEIAIHGLTDHFQLIHLKDKMLNVSTEMNSDSTDGTDVFKKVVAGDEVMASLKNKDFIKFKPYAKLLFATNKIMTSKDTTDGFLDRLVFIDFPCKYVSDPTASFHKKKIENYYEKFLLPNISGALLVAIEGLNDLLTSNKFVETEESDMHAEDLKRVSNPIYAFAVDNRLNGKADSMDNFYMQYSAWANSTNSGRYSKRKFTAEFKSTFNIKKYMGMWQITW